MICERFIERKSFWVIDWDFRRLHNYVQLVSVGAQNSFIYRHLTDCEPLGIVILWWDHIVSFPLEVTSIWKRPKTLISWIYLANRYVASIGNIAFFVIDWEKMSDKVRLILLNPLSWTHANHKFFQA